MSVEVGQVWASTHSMDVREGERQRRVVTQVDPPFVWFRTEGGRSGSTRVHMRYGKPPGYRLVEQSD